MSKMAWTELPWTDKGQAYAKKIGRSFDKKSPSEFREKVRSLRLKYGFLTWEVEKALMNNEGDVGLALRDLEEARRCDDARSHSRQGPISDSDPADDPAGQVPAQAGKEADAEPDQDQPYGDGYGHVG